MNERIQKLCKQAFSLADDENDRHVQEEGEELSLTQFDNFFHEKFAELIVRECCSMVNAYVQHNNPHDCLLVLDIKEHFGVEE